MAACACDLAGAYPPCLAHVKGSLTQDMHRLRWLQNLVHGIERGTVLVHRSPALTISKVCLSLRSMLASSTEKVCSCEERARAACLLMPQLGTVCVCPVHMLFLGATAVDCVRMTSSHAVSRCRSWGLCAHARFTCCRWGRCMACSPVLQVSERSLAATPEHLNIVSYTKRAPRGVLFLIFSLHFKE